MGYTQMEYKIKTFHFFSFPDMGCLFSNAMGHKPWQYKSNAIDCKEARRLKNKFPLPLPPIKT